MAKILLVEDDLYLAKMLKTYFKRSNFTVETVVSGEEALARLKIETYDVAIIDWGLPDIEGIEVLKQYRNSGGTIPVLILTGKNESREKVQGLDSGADDYLTKPFDTMELLARVRALLRRLPLVNTEGLKFGNLELDSENGYLKVGDTSLKLLPKEVSILSVFLKSPNQTISATELISKVWSTESEVVPDSIRPYLTKIRAKLKEVGADVKITTNKGFGYVIEEC